MDAVWIVTEDTLQGGDQDVIATTILEVCASREYAVGLVNTRHGRLSSQDTVHDAPNSYSIIQRECGTLLYELRAELHPIVY